uniref:ADAM metallopeptidase with thrombospondin type 1 motif 7 n=1 Tax=Labrus bergylta TaxID=56723 RepID=A0A3Q3FUL3_9LABR
SLLEKKGHIFHQMFLLDCVLRYLQDAPQYEVVHPTRVDARGHFLSNFLSHHVRRVQRREAPEGPADLDRVFYQLRHGGSSLHFNLTLNPNLLAPGFLTERRYGGLEGAKISPPGSSQCHYLGEVSDEGSVRGRAAISTCDGLTGLFKLSDDEFFIQPLEKTNTKTSAPQAHAIYKRHASPPSLSPGPPPSSGKQAVNGTCGVQNIERERERWEHRQQRRRKRIRQRSVSKEKWVETLVVADPKMVEHHGSKAVESYILAVMNIVASLFSDASIGNAINIVVVRLILLEKDEDDLKITHHADNSLNSFCKWQKKLNMKGDEHSLHHDVAVLLTRKDICASINIPCETLGLSHIAGMCQSHRSCSISEDTGLPLAFTVAHELGHNFGIQHDGNGNDCEPIGKRPFVMSPQLLYGTSLPRWSRCSRQYITRFLDRGWGWCLDDAPVKDKLSLNSVLPGVLYSAAHQCRLQYGSGSVLCDDMDNVCGTLWCTVGTTCHSKLDGAVDGTSCGEDKWCIRGECVAVGYEPESVNGGWASWSEWSACSRTCGAGVQSAHRDCDNPVPAHRGKYCLGERRRYKTCNTPPCPPDLTSFRSIQCSHFNSIPYKGRFHKWEAVINRMNPCELNCRPLNEDFSEKLRDAVIDGTPCYEGNKSRDMCINGICKNVGCDYVIESSAVEDRCGVCHGNGSTCTTVRRTFEESEGLGYVDIGLIPEGARDIRIEEVAEAGNFLALRSDIPNKYFLNGGWTIQWNGDYKAAGTVFTYERTGQLENLTSPGPTMEPLWIQLLFQETNPGVRYEFTINRNVSEDNEIPSSVFFWKYGSWTECSVTCGTGVQRQIVHCVEKTTGIVEEHFCDPLTRPHNNQTSCNKDPCPAIWWSGEWQKCSASCGSLGLTKRTVLCIQSVSAEEQEALQPSECEHMLKPAALSSCNTHIPCPADWTTGSWSKCSLTCGSGVRRRNVTCSRNTGVDCDPQRKPLAVTTCDIQDCPHAPDNFEGVDWSGSGWSSEEVLNEINSIPEVKPPPKYSTTRAQPRTHNDLNNDIEGDFHYHNNIENIDPAAEKSVQVDDFYYDYNFINFHEDLADDFESDGKDSEDSERSDAPHKAKPTHSVKDDAHMETTHAPTASSDFSTITKPNFLKTEEPQNTKPDESVHTSSENWDDFLSEEFLLPVSTTHSPPPSPTQHSPTQKQGHDILLWPENTSTMPIPVFPPNEPTQDVKWGQYGEEAEINYDNFSEEEDSMKEVTVNSKHAPPTPGHQTTIDIVVPTTWGVPDNYEYNEKTADNQQSVTHVKPHMELLSPADPVLPTNPPALWTLPALTSVQTSASTQVTIPAYWVTGNWSACSTTCGLGAIWRTLACSTGSDSDCDPAKRPAPAQRCYLRPCSMWKVEEWTKCSKNCEGGFKSREVQCFDMRDQRPLRPFHCRAMSSRPQSHMHCNTQLCLDWYASSWGECSEVCGGGEQQRIVACPEEDRCDTELQPSNFQSCNTQPCAQWLTGSWGQCSASCGGGVQRRLIKCVNTKGETNEEVDQAECDHEPQPETTRKCNSQECVSAPSGAVCLRDRLTSRFCQTLRWLGRCHLPNVRAQCCKSCSQRSRSVSASRR